MKKKCNGHHKNMKSECLEMSILLQKIEQTCPVSWWGHPTCGPCNCPLDKGYSSDCNKNSGECSCPPNHYQTNSSDHCIECNCYSTGSYDGQCDSTTGQCRCRPGVIGSRYVPFYWVTEISFVISRKYCVGLWAAEAFGHCDFYLALFNPLWLMNRDTNDWRPW